MPPACRRCEVDEAVRVDTIDTSTPVVVATVSPAYLLHGVVGIVRSLGRLGVTIHVVHDERWTPADFSRFLGRTFTATLDDGAPDRFLNDLLEVGRRVGRRAILVPVDDVTTLFVDDHAEALAERFTFPDRLPELTRTLSSKKELYLLCKRLGLPAPETIFPRSRGEVEAFAEQAAFPVVVKAIDPVLLRRQAQGRSVVIVEDADRLLDAYDHMEAAGDPNLMLQEFIPGGAESIWMFNGYFDADSECLAAFTGTKLRQYPPYTGPTCLGVCRWNPTVEQAAKNLLKAVAYRGIVDLGFRYDARDGQYKLLDVNPRIGASFRLFVGDGIDVARALYLDLTGQQVPRSSAPDGRRWMVEHHDLLASRVYRRNGELSVAQWVRSLRGVREAAWFAWDDPVPFAAMCWRSVLLARQRIGRLGTGFRRPHTRRHEHRGSSPGSQRLVNARFEREATFWDGVYREGGVFGAVHRHRQALALAKVDTLGLPQGSRVLEVGTGAGLTAVQLGARGFCIEAIDTTSAMLDLTRRRGAEAGLQARLRVAMGDAHALPFRAGSFGLVVALGVIPWLYSPPQAVREMARVLRPGGYLVVNADNRMRLTHFVDPLSSPPMRPLRRAVKTALAMTGLLRSDGTTATATFYALRAFDQIIEAAGLERMDGVTFGFGPFTLLGRKVIPNRLGLRLNHRLQRLADRGVPVVQSTGAQYLVVARKPG
jgi:predicted ATP-grasp superfamily ATP-dependent carboligase/ubiquinone/menaquinone biosynthesis C-methylase UbiE